MRMNNRVLRNLSNTQVEALKRTASQLRTEVIQANVIPYDEGFLQNVFTEVDNANAKRGKVSIIHNTDYAARLYFNPQYNFDTTTNANARGLWWEDWLTGSKKKRPMNLFKMFYRNLTGV